MKDYYYILGIKPNATTAEIKKAYRKLSIKFHPDKNDGDKFFEERFKEINEAHENLINEDRRKNYDYTFHNNANTKQENREDFHERNEDFSENELYRNNYGASGNTSGENKKWQFKLSNFKKLIFLLIIIIACVILFFVKTTSIIEDRGFFHFVLISIIFICICNIIGSSVSDGVVMVGLWLSAVYGLWTGVMFSDAVSQGSFDGFMNFIILVPCFIFSYGIGGALIGYVTKVLLDL